MWLQISSGKGPAECELAVQKLSQFFMRKWGKDIQLLHSEKGQKGFKSVLLSLEEPLLQEASQWQGSILWVSQSPFRPQHKRKNWFIACQFMAPPPQQQFSMHKLKFESLRASGPGGQNVNKVETAVRLTDLETGIVVVAQEERSQKRNRQLALARLQEKQEALNQEAQAEQKKAHWLFHQNIERGGALAIFEGPKFKLRQGPL